MILDKCHDYQPQQVIKSVEKLFDGTETIEVEDDFIDAFYQSADGLLLPDQDRKLFSNQYIVLIGKRDPKKSAVCRFINYHVPLRKVYNYKDIWGLSANNKEQKFAMDLHNVSGWL